MQAEDKVGRVARTIGLCFLSTGAANYGLLPFICLRGAVLYPAVRRIFESSKSLSVFGV